MNWIQNVNYKGWLAFLVCLLVLISCKENLDNNVFLPETKVLAVNENRAVVASEYLRVRISPDASSNVLSYLREGQVVELLGRSERKEVINEGESYWYEILCQGGRGWVHGSYLNFSVLIIPINFAFDNNL